MPKRQTGMFVEVGHAVTGQTLLIKYHTPVAIVPEAQSLTVEKVGYVASD